MLVLSRVGNVETPGKGLRLSLEFGHFTKCLALYQGTALAVPPIAPKFTGLYRLLKKSL
jgi:hypothetical protein